MQTSIFEKKNNLAYANLQQEYEARFGTTLDKITVIPLTMTTII